MGEGLAFVDAARIALGRPGVQHLPSNQAHLKYRADIDGLRAIAVIPVVLYHSGLGFRGGYVGVDVFFVISGYLITKIIYDLALAKRFSFVDFYDRRIRRLFPALFVMLGAVTLWSVTHMIWMDVRDFGRSLTAATIYLSNFYFHLVSGYFGPPARTMPLLHTWSLAVEEQFYIAVPFALFALVRFLPRPLHVPVIAGVSVGSFALCVWVTSIDAPAAFYLLPMRAWELGLGGAVAISSPPVWRHRWIAHVLSAAGIAAILFAALSYSDGTPFPGWRAAVPTIGTAMILSTGGRSGALVERILSTRPFTFVGKISYSLYLWHWPVIVAFTYAALGPMNPLGSASAVAVSFVLAVLSWRFVERPFRTRRLLPTAQSLFTAAAASSAAAVLVGQFLYATNGYPQRYPRQLVAVLDNVDARSISPECFSVTLKQVRQDKICVRGALGVPPSFVLVGDSHAGALSDGLFAAAKSRGMAGAQFTAIRTVPLPGMHRSPNDVHVEELTRAFPDYLANHRELKTVIVTGYWVHLVDPHGSVLLYDAQYDGSGTAYNRVALRHGLEHLATSFPDRRFIFLDDVPSGDALNPQLYVRAVYNGRHPDPGLSREIEESERATYEPILKDIAANHQNVTYLPVLARICGPRICPLFRAGHPLFRDGAHLTMFGSMQLQPALRAVFDQVRNGPPKSGRPLH